MKKKIQAKASKVRIVPLADRVLVRPFTEQDLRNNQSRSQSLSFILPESMTQEKSAQGQVLAVGPGRYSEGKLIPVSLKVGDVVIFSKYGYEEVKQGEEELYLLREENILAVVK